MTRPSNALETPPAGARLVIVGAGFAGGSLLRHLPPALQRPGETLLVDRAWEYAFIPLIHEVAVGRVHPDSVRVPIAPDDAPYATVRAEATGLDLENDALLTSAGPIKYRYLVLAPGSVAIPPPEKLKEHFQTFWSLEDALRLRSRLNASWTAALNGGAPPGGLTIAIVGGGATGVELAGEIVTLFDHLRKRSARRLAIEPKVVLLEAKDRLMDWLGPYYHKVALEELGRLGVDVRLNSPVREANGAGVRAGEEWLPAAIRVWAAGVQANPLIRGLPGKHDDAGRALVNEHLTLHGRPNVYVLGDSGVYEHLELGPLPPTASVAVQQGPWVARDLKRRLRGAASRRWRPPFRFFDRGYAVSLGPESGVADPLGVRTRGRAAQALYRSVLLYFIKSRRGRLLTGADWAMERALGRVGFDYPVNRTTANKKP